MPSEFRHIHHLLSPKGSSVNNDAIDPKLCSIKYASFDSAVVMMAKLGKGALFAKCDIKSAFKFLPVHLMDFKLLVFTFKCALIKLCPWVALFPVQLLNVLVPSGMVITSLGWQWKYDSFSR